jgi:D-alanyl-lipoteichoic acid acyltransferase DltB (MBOAT superfamily)
LYFLWSKYLPALMHVFSGGGVGPVLVPLGVSYFSFKLLHYAIEQRRGNFPTHGLEDFVAWLYLAPIFTAGPIERFEHFLGKRKITFFKTQAGSVVGWVLTISFVALGGSFTVLYDKAPIVDSFRLIGMAFGLVY